MNQLLTIRCSSIRMDHQLWGQYLMN